MATSKLENDVKKNTPLIKRVSYNFNFNVASGVTQWIAISPPTVDGYSYIGISTFDAGSNGYRVFFPTINEHGVRVTNSLNYAYSGTGTITALYIRDDLD